MLDWPAVFSSAFSRLSDRVTFPRRYSRGASRSHGRWNRFENSSELPLHVVVYCRICPWIEVDKIRLVHLSYRYNHGSDEGEVRATFRGLPEDGRCPGCGAEAAGALDSNVNAINLGKVFAALVSELSVTYYGAKETKKGKKRNPVRSPSFHNLQELKTRPRSLPIGVPLPRRMSTMPPKQSSAHASEWNLSTVITKKRVKEFEDLEQPRKIKWKLVFEAPNNGSVGPFLPAIYTDDAPIYFGAAQRTPTETTASPKRKLVSQENIGPSPAVAPKSKPKSSPRKRRGLSVREYPSSIPEMEPNTPRESPAVLSTIAEEGKRRVFTPPPSVLPPSITLRRAKKAANSTDSSSASASTPARSTPGVKRLCPYRTNGIFPAESPIQDELNESNLGLDFHWKVCTKPRETPRLDRTVYMTALEESRDTPMVQIFEGRKKSLSQTLPLPAARMMEGLLKGAKEDDDANNNKEGNKSAPSLWDVTETPRSHHSFNMNSFPGLAESSPPSSPTIYQRLLMRKRGEAFPAVADEEEEAENNDTLLGLPGFLSEVQGLIANIRRGLRRESASDNDRMLSTMFLGYGVLALGFCLGVIFKLVFGL